MKGNIGPAVSHLFRPLIILLWLTTLSAVMVSQETRSEFNSLTLRLSALKTEFVMLEPIPLSVVLQNQTGRSIVAHTALRFGDKRLRVSIQPAGSRGYIVDQLTAEVASVLVPPVTIKPGERFENTEPLMFALDRWLPGPGEYDLQLILLGLRSGEEISSNTVRLTIREPDADAEGAFKFIRATGRASSFLAGIVQNDAQVAELEEFVDAFNGTPYGDYAIYSMGLIYETRGEYDRARSQYTAVSGKKQFPFAAEATKRLSRLK